MSLPKIDPDDPRAPSQEVWDALSDEERREVVRLLPNEVPWELAPPEGDPHRKAGASILDALDNYFRSRGRNVYLSSNLAVFYPDEPRFAPDLIAVLDVSPHDRMKWVVSDEGKGLDWALDVLVRGSETKDLELNVERFARLGIPEYFVFDVPRSRLFGFRLAPNGGAYQPILPQQGHWYSEVLELGLAIENGRIRFYAGTAVLLETTELAERANRLLQERMEQLAAASERAETEAQRAETEAQRAELAEQELAALRAELERLKRS